MSICTPYVVELSICISVIRNPGLLRPTYELRSLNDLDLAKLKDEKHIVAIIYGNNFHIIK